MTTMFDSHIHLDQFTDLQIGQILSQPFLSGVLAVATDLASSQRLLQLKQRFGKIYCAAGFHPEQVVPSTSQQQQLFDWIAKNRQNLTACGEVGLPHYRKRANSSLNYQPYIELLEAFIVLCKRYDLPINLHIVYEDTLIALELLAKHQLAKAHFHWFKASPEIVEKVLDTNYRVSVTSDILWNEKTQYIVQQFPLDRLLIETDAPWQHQGFQTTAISEQLSATVEKIAQIKGNTVSRVHRQILANFEQFYLG